MREIPFGAADALHHLSGGRVADDVRIQAGIHAVLKEQAAHGHIGVSMERLVVLLGERLCVNSTVLPSLSSHLHPKIAVEQKGQIVLAEVVRQLKEVERCLATNQMQLTDYDDPRLRQLLSHKYTVLTGSAGSGKTQLLRQVIDACHQDGLRVAVTATTGKAASLLGAEGQTVHRLLNFGPEGFSRRILSNDVVLVDEGSMLTLPVLVALLRVVRGILIISGDPGQLPPVHGISVFGYLLERLPVLQLERIAAIRGGKGFTPPVYTFQHHSIESVLQQLDQEIQAARGRGKLVQVLSPVKESSLGMHELNRWLQMKMNPQGAFLTEKFRLADPVIVLRNDYDLPVPVLNGQTGVVTGLQEGRIVLRLNSGVEALVSESNLDLAYCMTVHKAQGSRFPVVIFVIPEKEYKSFTCDKRLRYVGRTRGLDKTVCLVH
ncbi:MAG: hypothetical protein NPIRA04_03950 [Nitrospirales bacterium]|nr:MAG: hypothetical protein NPIRA04_03950 [Nitrospirales bacterium]